MSPQSVRSSDTVSPRHDAKPMVPSRCAIQLFFQFKNRCNKIPLRPRVCRTIRNLSVDETSLLFNIACDQLGICGKSVTEVPQHIRLGTPLGNQMNMKPKDRPIEGEAASSHRPVIGMSYSSRLMLKAHGVNDCAHFVQMPVGNQQHQVKNALAFAAGHGCAAHVLHGNCRHGGLKQSHDAVGCRRSASIPGSQAHHIW